MTQNSKKIFNILGWIMLIVIGLSFIINGYSNWNVPLLLLTYLCFSINNDSLNVFKQLSISQKILILIGFIISVVIAFGLIQIASFIINDKLHLSGAIKTISIIIAIIIFLYPITFLFGGFVNKILKSIDTNRS